MQSKQYAAKYKDNFGVIAISEDLADDYKVYLKLHEGAMNCVWFRVGTKELHVLLHADDTDVPHIYVS